MSIAPMTLAERLTENQRLVVLRVLDEAPGYSANESILHDMVVAWGDKISRDQARTLIAWLRDQGLVRVEEIRGYFIATITQRGSDVVKGYVTAPGVKRPSPGRE